MFIIQTLRAFMENPMGKGSNAIPSRKLILEDLEKRYFKIIDHKEKKVTVDIYRNGDEYYFHFLIPSETERRNTYDVVLHFCIQEENKDAVGDKNLNRYLVKFFSNNPSFTYTYAHAFALHGLFVDSLSDKFKKEVFQNPPVTRNPGDVVNYEKSIMFACIHLTENDQLLSKVSINAIAKKYNAKQFDNLIRNTDKIEMEIKLEESRLKQEADDEKKKAKKEEKRSERKGTIAKTTQGSKPDSNIKRIEPKSSSAGSRISPRGTSKGKIKPR